MTLLFKSGGRIDAQVEGQGMDLLHGHPLAPSRTLNLRTGNIQGEWEHRCCSED